MKKHHKMLSVGGAVLALLVIAFLYKRNSKEGNTTMRAAQKLTAKQEQGLIAATMAAIAAFFTSILEMLGLSKKQPAPKIAGRTVASTSARAGSGSRASKVINAGKGLTPAEQKLRQQNRDRAKAAAAKTAAKLSKAPASNAPRAGPDGRPIGGDGKPVGKMTNAQRKDAKAAAQARAASPGAPPPPGAPASGAPAPAPASGASAVGGAPVGEGFTTMQRGGAWRPRGSIAPM